MAITLHSLRAALAPDSWYVKGSAALSAWIGPAARLPNDLDLVVPAKAAQRLLMQDALPYGPRGESLCVARHEPVVFSSGSSPTVYRALVEIRGPEMLPPVLLNLLLAQEGEGRDRERTTLLGFPGPTGEVTVPSVTGYRFLAEKLVRYSRQRSGGRVNTRWQDLTDMLRAVAHPAFPALRLKALCQDLMTEMADHGRTPPACLPAPPAEWLDFWDTATFVDGLPFGRLPEAAGRLARFWEPVLRCPEQAPEEEADAMDAVWSPDAWS
ncbi:nucleotidyl transferase AbiEii/AbiGii toxin family protein [Streptomyces sp. MST-110588]|uniref:nucleotidyl transferase AbiEii/AbiGii toxin family protein n=1 Tax=Streptomyces sp. MST-110588 TaxID=2833628 RepID=UPI001F5D4121|nr:nucleotidyl transferase AbiEii/AbiGii toxin family protein [Streptomyces sp. MST-110588]UNO42198.1 nucleotidyl transferase AbiEii/AbiGii toxin family protein [Streptomyces sp. MST-110588]